MMKYLFTGFPYTGTLYVTKLLLAHGIQAAHEAGQTDFFNPVDEEQALDPGPNGVRPVDPKTLVSANGMVAYQAAIKGIPLRLVLEQFYPRVKVIHLLRDPAKVISGWASLHNMSVDQVAEIWLRANRETKALAYRQVRVERPEQILDAVGARFNADHAHTLGTHVNSKADRKGYKQYYYADLPHEVLDAALDWGYQGVRKKEDKMKLKLRTHLITYQDTGCCTVFERTKDHQSADWVALGDLLFCGESDDSIGFRRGQIPLGQIGYRTRIAPMEMNDLLHDGKARTLTEQEQTWVNESNPPSAGDAIVSMATAAEQVDIKVPAHLEEGHARYQAGPDAGHWSLKVEGEPRVADYFRAHEVRVTLKAETLDKDGRRGRLYENQIGMPHDDIPFEAVTEVLNTFYLLGVKKVMAALRGAQKRERKKQRDREPPKRKKHKVVIRDLDNLSKRDIKRLNKEAQERHDASYKDSDRR